MHTLRAVVFQRGYVALATLTLTLAVGANLVVFSLVKALWLRPVVLSDPDRLVMVMGDSGQGPEEKSWFTKLGLTDQIATSGAFLGTAGQVATSDTNSGFKPTVTMPEVRGSFETAAVTFEYFSVLGLHLQGRDFVRSDDRLGAEPVGIISERLWRSAFRSRPQVIGTVISASPVAIRIVGIAPSGFHGARLGENVDLWIPSNLVARVSPIRVTREVHEDEASLLAIARLKPGTTHDQAERIVADRVSSLGRTHPVQYRVIPLQGVFGSSDSATVLIPDERIFSVVMASAMLVLLAGCATLMALVLVHYERRRTELAVRLALGASRGKLSVQLAKELAWLIAPGGLAASLVAGWTLRALPTLTLPGGVDLGRLDLSVDWRVVFAGFACVLLTLAIAALVPVARFTRPDLAQSLVSTASATPASYGLRQVLIALHISTTVVLLVASGLFVRTVTFGYSRGPGFDVDRTLFVDVQTSAPYAPRGRTFEEVTALIAAEIPGRVAAENQVVAAIRGLPGTVDVALGRSPVGVDSLWSLVASPLTIVHDHERRDIRALQLSVAPGFLRALGVPLLEGREFVDADATASPIPVIVSASVARQLWAAEPSIGKELQIADRQLTVVGVARDTAVGSLVQGYRGAVFRPTTIEQWGRSHTLSLVVRSEWPARLVEPVRRIIGTTFPDAPRVDIATGHDIIARDLGRERFGAWFFSGFGLVTLTLGVAGVFGLVAYLAESRHREFGVRVALGATPQDLVRQAVAVGLKPVAVGAVIGLVLAAWLAQFAASLLVGVSQLDPLTYVCAAVLMTGCAAVASLFAAWRVRRLAPMDALRAE